MPVTMHHDMYVYVVLFVCVYIHMHTCIHIVHASAYAGIPVGTYRQAFMQKDKTVLHQLINVLTHNVKTQTHNIQQFHNHF